MELYVVAAVIILICFLILFIIGTLLKNNSIVDMGWGIGFIIANFGLIIYRGEITVPSLLNLILISIWGLRLFGHIFYRNYNKPEDFRYAKWRKEWGKWVVVRSFFQIYLLQALFMWIVSFTYIFMYPVRYCNLLLYFAAFMKWLIGFIFESVSDRELSRFMSKPENKGQVLTTGLWKYTRHPNYFGEATMWWGIAFISFAASGSLLPFIGSAFITFSLLYISGVPILEKRNQNKPGYQEYKAKTSKFIPWFPKR